uniref:Uncharacterized protein n=1 Tax=Aegilops tauschii subsp. strangulata TaxID=200361 RepID=A0A453D173_AEGTS
MMSCAGQQRRRRRRHRSATRRAIVSRLGGGAPCPGLVGRAGRLSPRRLVCRSRRTGAVQVIGPARGRGRSICSTRFVCGVGCLFKNHRVLLRVYG